MASAVLIRLEAHKSKLQKKTAQTGTNLAVQLSEGGGGLRTQLNPIICFLDKKKKACEQANAIESLE